MPLDAEILGTELYTMASAWNDQQISPEDLEQARQDFWNGVAEKIISHFKTSAVVHTTGTAAAQTGTIS